MSLTIPTPADRSAVKDRLADPANSRPTAELRQHTFGELLDLSSPPREEILSPWLRQRQLSMVFAPAGVGKSLLVMSIALAVAGGGSLFGWSAPRPRKVLLVDGEMDLEDLRERMEMLLPTIPGIDRATVRENGVLFAQQAQPPRVEFPDLATEEGREEIINRADQTGADLVILDNLSTLATIQDENAAHSFDPVLDLMLDLKLGGQSVILVHHAGKKGGYRGTSKMAVPMHSIISLQDPGEDKADGADFRVVFDKYRGLHTDSTRPFRATLRHDTPAVCTARWETTRPGQEQIEALVSLVRSGNYTQTVELADAMGLTKGRISQLKKKAIDLGILSAAQWDYYMSGVGDGGDCTVEDQDNP